MKIPTKQQAETFLAEAERLNPGPWVPHSQYVAQAASVIAEHHPTLNPEQAYILGLLHDIGRREGVTKMRHALDGYTFLHEKGFDDAARIAITHSFPLLNNGIYGLATSAGQWDCTDAEMAFIENYLRTTPINDYDRLIQLCDALALSTGCTLVEKRLLDVALRHGFNEYTRPRWRAYLTLKDQFSEQIGQSIYNILPNVITNTFS